MLNSLITHTMPTGNISEAPVTRDITRDMGTGAPAATALYTYIVKLVFYADLGTCSGQMCLAK